MNLRDIVTGIIGKRSNTMTLSKGGSLYMYLQNNVVMLCVSGSSAAYSTGWNSLGNLPAEYRPVTTFSSLIIDNASTDATKALLPINIDASTGLVRIYKYSNMASSIQPLGELTYLTGSIE